MEPSSPLTPVNGEHEYRADMILVSNGNTHSHCLEDVQIELTPRSESSFLPHMAAPAPMSDDAAPLDHESRLGPSQEPVNDAAQVPSDDALPPPNTPLKKIIEADSSSMQVEISPAPVPLSYTANAFALTRPSTPPPASSARGDPEQQYEATEIPETPAVPSTPVLSEIGATPSTLHTPINFFPSSRARSRKTSSPSAFKTDTAKDEAGDLAATPKAAEMNMDGTGDPAPRTTTRSGRQVVQPKSMRESTPSPPTTKAKGRGQAKEKASAKTRIAARTPRSADATGSPAVTPAVLRRRKAEAARWKTDSLLSSNRSPLINHDLRSILLRPDTWDVLSREEQDEILALFPSMTNVSDPGTDTARPNVASLINDNNFRHDCARYTNDLENGFFEREWLAEAFEAHMMRNQGAFDDYVVGEFEKAWGVTVPNSMRRVKSHSEPGSNSTKESEKKSIEEPTRDGEDGAAPKDIPPSPTSNGKPTAIEKADPTKDSGPIESTGPTELTEKDAATSKADKGQTEVVNAESTPASTIGTKETAAPDSLAAAPESEAPPPLSLRLGSPLASEDEEDGQIEVDTKKSSTKARPTSPETKDVIGKRKASAAQARKGKRRKSPRVEPSEADKDDEEKDKQTLEQPASKTADNAADNGAMATEQ